MMKDAVDGLISVYLRNILAEYSIRELMKLLKTKSYSWTYGLVQGLGKQGILRLDKKGNTCRCRLDLDNQKTIELLCRVEEETALNSNLPHAQKILNLIDLNYFTLIVTGSYASGKNTKTSDLDVVVIVPTGTNQKSVLNVLVHEGELMTPELHPYVFTEDEFHAMLVDKKENYGKEITRNHKIIHGAAAYYRLLIKAIKHGFTG